MKKRWAILGGLVTASLTYFGIGNYFYNFGINSKKEKNIIENSDNMENWGAKNPELLEKEKQEQAEFLRMNPPTEVSIHSTQNPELRLVADVYKNTQTNSKWVIIAHGYSANASEMVLWAKEFHQQDFNVLAVDLRGHGRSDGDYIGMGYHDRFDILDWIDWIITSDAQAEIALFGLSMGAATMMMTAGENLPEQVKVIVEDCGYSTTVGVFKHQIKEMFDLPPAPIMHMGNSVIKLRAGYDVHHASPVEALKNNKTPILFIHGDQDTFVPFEMLAENFEATTAEKELLVIEGAAHGDARRVNPALYWSTIHKFMHRYM